MRIRVPIALLLLAAAGLAAAQAYRWVDENGVVHYSDRPREGAVEIVLPRDTQPSRPRPALRAAAAEAAGSEGDDEDESYRNFEIVSPGAEETLWNIGGTLDVRLRLEPALKPGHRVRIYFDGEPRMVSGTSFVLEEVWRGVHNIQAEVVDATGKLQIRTAPNRFYVQQTSVLPNTPGNFTPR